MASLKFTTIDGKSKYAVGMYAKDGEYVEFNHPCNCCGPVRLHLVFINRLRTQLNSLRNQSSNEFAV